MRVRSTLSIAVGVSCLTAGVLAGGALAHGGDHGRKSGIEVKVRGVVTALTPASATTAPTITVSPGGTLAPWTCAIPTDEDTTDLVVNTTTVAMKCRDRNGVLTARHLHISDDTTGRVKVEASGLVTAFTALSASAAGSITINPGTGLPTVTCAVTDRTRLRGTPVVNTDTAKIECKTRDGVLTAKKIRVKSQSVTPPYGVAPDNGNGRGHGGRHRGRGKD
jgi:hypothetical protein